MKKEFTCKVFTKEASPSKIQLSTSFFSEYSLFCRRVIDNKAASIISKEDLVAYFQKPDAELKLIDMDDFAIKDMDWISSDVLKNNTDSITEFKRYEADVDSTDDKGISSIMTRNLRDLAKKDALGLIREWRDHARFNQ